MMRIAINFVRDEDGAGMVEYALLLALIAVALVAVASSLGYAAWGLYASAGSELDDIAGTVNEDGNGGRRPAHAGVPGPPPHAVETGVPDHAQGGGG